MQYSHIVSRERNVRNCCAEVPIRHTKIHQSSDARRRETTGAIAHVDKNFSAASNTNQPTCDTLHQRADPQVLAQHVDTATINIEGIMARRTIEQRLAQLEAQKKTLQSRLGKQERARDTRRKVLLGALVLHRLQSDKPRRVIGLVARLAHIRAARVPDARHGQSAAGRFDVRAITRDERAAIARHCSRTDGAQSGSRTGLIGAKAPCRLPHDCTIMADGALLDAPHGFHRPPHQMHSGSLRTRQQHAHCRDRVTTRSTAHRARLSLVRPRRRLSLVL